MSAFGQARTFASQVPSALRAVFANPELRRVELAFAGFNAAEWAVWIAMIVYAYDRGGATTAGLVAVAQLVPAAVFAPFASTLGDRFRAGRVLLWGYVAQTLGMGATAAVLLTDGPALAAYAFAASAATAVTVTRPTQAALVPALARRPRELTAANVVSGWIESLSVLVAPAVAGILLDVGGPGWVFALMACVTAVSAWLVLSVPGPPPAGAPTHRPNPLGETLDALHALRSEPEARALVLLLGVEFAAIGALDVLYAELAIGELGLSDGWTGYFNAAFGLGGTLAIVVTATLVGRRRLAPALVGGLATWFIAFVLIGLRPTAAVAVTFLVVGGAGRVVVDVAGRTLLQRLAPANLLSRVFGVLEGLTMAGLALGSLLAPALVALGGVQLALLGVGALLPLAALLASRSLAQMDRKADVPVVEIGLLRSLPLFAPLGAPALESLARALQPIDVPRGTAVVSEGEAGDCFYVVADGRVEARQAGRVVTVLGRGDGFGEIALLYDVPRTATCLSTEPSHLYALERRSFLEAVTGNPAVAGEAHRLATQRMAALAGESAGG